MNKGLQFQALGWALFFTSSVWINPCISQSYALLASESKVDFSIKNLGIAVDGQFKKLAGELKVNSNNGQPEFMYGEIKVNSIETGIAMRDRHLLKADYFDAERFPQLKFRSESIVPQGKGYTIKGWISIKGKSQPIQLAAEMVKTSKGYLVKSKFQVKRSSFNLGDSALLSDEIWVVWNLVFSQ
ncbi:MAG: YceI family protein [Bacteroidetes bacterium]|nr:YceI family protein [Bacteroidota bacterium]